MEGGSQNLSLYTVVRRTANETTSWRNSFSVSCEEVCFISMNSNISELARWTVTRWIYLSSHIQLAQKGINNWLIDYFFKWASENEIFSPLYFLQGNGKKKELPFLTYYMLHCMLLTLTTEALRSSQISSGAPNVNFRKISVRKTIWDLEFS